MASKGGRRYWSGCADTDAKAGALSRSMTPSKPKVPGALTPEQKIKSLEVQLQQAQEKAQLFEAVLDVLKKDYGVRVVKKPSGKSWRKSS